MAVSDADTQRRHEMVRTQIAARGVRSRPILEALREVPRERFIEARLARFAYEDTPLPIEEGQTISQPYIVALMCEQLQLEAGDRVLEVGTGSGYAAAVLSRMADEVHTIERHGTLARLARERFEDLGYDNIHVRAGDGTRGWPEAAPFDAIVVAAGGPQVPDALKRQLAIGGRLVIPVGETLREQSLVRVVRRDEDTFEQEALGAVRFVPLIGAEGWEDATGIARSQALLREPRQRRPPALYERIAEAAEPFEDIASADLSGLLARIGDARVVALGEASHGTSEFYRMRTRITQALIEARGFNLIAVEADWPDAAMINHHVRRRQGRYADWRAFERFPTWMWRNEEVAELVRWLRRHNAGLEPEAQVGFHGLDLYSLHRSIGQVLDFLDARDPALARKARGHYGCLSPWEQDPAVYGRAVLMGGLESCEGEVVDALKALLDERLTLASKDLDGDSFLDAMQNARLVANAERYYRVMYQGSVASWNLRDNHMFDTLEALLAWHGPDAKAIVWAHNSHLGDASFTEMGARGELNLGQLCRERFGDEAYLVGFGTHAGTVAAASSWDEPMEVKRVRPSREDSYERLCHDSDVARFMLPVRDADAALREGLARPRLERAIGVIYRPQTELQSHYFQADLSRQFDEYIWFDETCAVTPLEGARDSADGSAPSADETWPFGL